MRAASEITQGSSSLLSGPDCEISQPATPTIKTISLSEDPPALQLIDVDDIIKSPEIELTPLDCWKINMVFEETADTYLNPKCLLEEDQGSVSGGASVFLENGRRRDRFMSERYLDNSVFGFLKQRKWSTKVFNTEL